MKSTSNLSNSTQNESSESETCCTLRIVKFLRVNLNSLCCGSSQLENKSFRDNGARLLEQEKQDCTDKPWVRRALGCGLGVAALPMLMAGLFGDCLHGLYLATCGKPKQKIGIEEDTHYTDLSGGPKV